MDIHIALDIVDIPIIAAGVVVGIILWHLLKAVFKKIFLC